MDARLVLPRGGTELSVDRNIHLKVYKLARYRWDHIGDLRWPGIWS